MSCTHAFQARNIETRICEPLFCNDITILRRFIPLWPVFLNQPLYAGDRHQFLGEMAITQGSALLTKSMNTRNSQHLTGCSLSSESSSPLSVDYFFIRSRSPSGASNRLPMIFSYAPPTVLHLRKIPLLPRLGMRNPGPPTQTPRGCQQTNLTRKKSGSIVFFGRLAKEDSGKSTWPLMMTSNAR